MLSFIMGFMLFSVSLRSLANHAVANSIKAP